MRTRASAERVGRRTLDHLTVLEQPQDALALGLVDPVDRQHAVEVVELVLEHPTDVVVGLHEPLLAVEVEGAEGDHLGAHDGEADVGDREAPLGPLALAALLDDLRVDRDAGAVVGVEDEVPLRDADLGGREAAAGRGAAERSAGVVDGGTISGGPGGGVLTVGLRVSVDGRPGVPASSSTLPRPYRIVSTPSYDPTDYLAGLCPNARGFDGLGWWWTVDVVDRATGAIVQSRVTCVPIPGPGTIGSGPVVAQPPHLGDIWQHAPIRPPTLGLSPPNEGVTGLDTRYWSTSPSVVDIDVTLAGWRVRGRAVRRAVAIDPGEGPVQFRPDGGSANHPAAHHVYERHGSYVVQSAALWDATVTLSGHGFTSGRPTSIGTAIVSVSGTYPVVEVRSVLTG